MKTIPDLIHFPLRYQSPLLLHCCPKCTACIHLFKSLASPSPFVTTVQQHPPIPRQASSSSPRLTCLLPTLPTSATLQLSAFPSNRRGIGAVFFFFFFLTVPCELSFSPLVPIFLVAVSDGCLVMLTSRSFRHLYLSAFRRVLNLQGTPSTGSIYTSALGPAVM